VEEYNFQRLILQAIFQTSYFGYGEGLMAGRLIAALKRCATNRPKFRIRDGNSLRGFLQLLAGKGSFDCA
jgi:hypothetical protein